MFNNIILTGIPRSGTTLSCSILNKYHNTIALMEPMNPFDLNDKNMYAIEAINNFMFESRKKVFYENKIITKHIDGIIPTNPIEDTPVDSTQRRKAIVILGEITITEIVQHDFTLIVKHNAFFTSILKELVTFFPCYAIIRNPLSVLASWSTVDLPVGHGSIPAGEKFDLKLQERLNSVLDVLERQIIILEWFFYRFDTYIEYRNIFKYEDIISSHGENLSLLSYDTSLNLPLPELENKNTSSLYQNIDIDRIYKKLMSSKSLFWKYYSKQEISNVYIDLKNKSE